MRRDEAPVDHRIAVSGGENEKALSLTLSLSLPGLGPWRFTDGPRRFAFQDFTPQAVGFDSRAVHPYYTCLSRGALQ
jgi:hypothetical protein